MDALTNVVAVLILVLVLVQADAARKVVKFLEDLQPATPEQVEQSRKLLEKATARKQSITRKLAEEAPSPAQLDQEQQRIAMLEKELSRNEEWLADLQQLKALEAEVRKQRDSEHAETVRIQEQIAELEALLDQTPVLKEPPPVEVTIPDSRPIPPRAVVYHAYAINDRVHIIDPHTPLEIFNEEFRKHRWDWVVRRVRRPGADQYIHDARKIAAHFDNFDFKAPPGQKVEVIANPRSTQLVMSITPDREKGGTSIDRLDEKGSPFSKAAAALMGDDRAVLLFHVHPNAFNTYLRARGLIDRTKIPAGWEVSGAASHRFVIPDVDVERLEQPPPPPPDAPPPPKGPPPIGPKLD